MNHRPFAPLDRLAAGACRGQRGLRSTPENGMEGP